MKKKKLLFISLEHWDEIWRRNQFLAVRLQKDFVITFTGPEIPFWKIFSKKLTKYQNIKIKYIYKFFPERFFSVFNQIFYKIQTSFFARDVLWINDQAKYFLNASKIIYDITDDWTLIDKKAKKADELLCQKADIVIVCSQKLLKTRAKYQKKLFLIRNGIDYQPIAAKGVKEEYFLYTGSLHEERLDVSLILALAKKYPEERFVFIGPIFFSENTLNILKKYKNIELWGARPYKQIPFCMAKAKALVVPHLVTPFVNSLDPIKQYEYLLSDKPVIATQVSGFKDLADVFYLAKNKNDFLLSINKVLLKKITVNYKLRLKYARENSWDKRYNYLRGVIC